MTLFRFATASLRRCSGGTEHGKVGGLVREPGLPVTAIARKCGLNISTSYHLVRTLAYEGYLVRLPNGTYVIGESVARRFRDLVTSLERPPEASVVLRQLSERVGLSSYLGLLQDERVTVVEVAEAVGSPYLEDFEVGQVFEHRPGRTLAAWESFLHAARSLDLSPRVVDRHYAERIHGGDQPIGRLRRQQ